MLPPKLGECDQHRLKLETVGDMQADRQLAISQLGDCAAKVETDDQWRLKHAGS